MIACSVSAVACADLPCDYHQLFSSVLRHALIQGLRFFGEVLQGRQQAQPGLVAKAKQGIKLALSAFSVVGINVKAFFDVLEFLGTQLWKRIEKSIKSKLPLPAVYQSALALCSSSNSDAAAVEHVGEAVSRYASCCLSSVLSVGFTSGQQSAVHNFALIGANRAMRYLVDHDQPFTAESVLLGLFVGRSGAGKDSFFSDHELKLRRGVPLTAEALYGVPVAVVSCGDGIQLHHRRSLPVDALSDDRLCLGCVQLPQWLFDHPDFPHADYTDLVGCGTGSGTFHISCALFALS